MNKLYKKIKRIIKWFLATWLRRILASFLIILFIITPLSFLLFNKKTEAAWFDDAWYYRKSIPLTNNTTEESNVYVAVTLDTSDTTKFQADCGDLRFTKYNGEIMPYYIASGCGTGSTSVYVAFDTFPAGQQTFFYYYGNPSAPNGNTLAQTGSVTQANMKMSIVNGTAFADFSAAGTLTENLGKKVTITDSASKKLTGYIKAAGTGETYGSEIVSNGNMETNDPPSSWGGNGGSVLSRVSDERTGGAGTYSMNAVNGGSQWMALQSVTTVSAASYAVTAWVKNVDHSHVSVQILNTVYGSLGVSNYVSNTSWTAINPLNFTAVDTGSRVVLQGYHGSLAGKQGRYDDVSVKQVLTPSTTGVTITSSSNGGTYNWTNEESGFNRNGSSGYTYVVYPLEASTEASNYTVGSLGSEEKSTAPVGYWSFDEGYGGTAHDETSKKNDGTLGTSTATPIWKTESECVSGKCLAFDGTDDYVSLPNELVSAANIRSGGITYSAWIKTNNNAIEQRIVGQKQSSGYSDYSSGGIGISVSGYARMIAYDDGIAYKYSDSATVLQKNTWYFISGTYDPADQKIRVYVNGILEGTPTTITTFSRLIANDDNRVGISTHGTSPYPFNGNIDEPKIYPYARTVAQIRQDYSAGLAGAGKAKVGSSVSIGGKSDKWMTDGLVGHWKMDETSWSGSSGEVIDASGNGNNGTSTSGAATAAGKFGNGGIFDGNSDYISIPDATSLNVNSASFSFSSWIKINTLGRWQNIYQSGTNDGDWAFEVTNNNKLDISIKSGSDYESGGGTITDTNWHHVAIVKSANSGTSVSFYIDGAKVGTASVPAVSNSNSVKRIGGDAFWNTDFWGGSLDETRLYNRILTDSEIQKLSEWAPGPVGEWKMDEKVSGDAKTLNDTSGNGNDGTTYWGANTSGMDCTVPGKYGTGCQFDGTSDYVEVGEDASINLSDNHPFTISYYLNLRSFPGGDFYATVMKGDWQVGYGHLIDSGGSFRVYYDSGSYLDASSFFNGSDIDTWVHVVEVYDGDKIRMYKNGGNTHTSAGGITLQTDTNSLYFGNQSGSSGSYHLDGKMDDVRIYNYARTQKQILEDMNGPSTSSGQAGLQYPVAYYKFDEGFSNVANNSGIGGSILNGTISGATWSQSGKFSKALSWDSTDLVSSNLIYNNATAFTLSAYVYPTSTGSFKIIAGTSKGNNVDSGIILVDNNVCYHDYVTSGDYSFCSTNNPVQLNQWQHVAFSYNSGSINIYHNGINVKNGTFTKTDTSASLIIGGNTSLLAERVFSGLIDEVKIYNYALTADDVKADYNRGSSTVLGSTGTTSTGAPDSSSSREYCVPGDTTSCAGPVAEWKMDEKVSGDAKTLYDTSGNGNDGTTDDGANNTEMDCTVPGKFGSGCSFDGVDDYIQLDSNVTLQNTDWTVSAWSKTGDAEVSILANKSGGPAYNAFQISNSKISYFHYNGSWTREYGTSNVADNRWHYLTWSNNGTAQTVDLYVDGKWEANVSSSIVGGAGLVDVIGRYWGGSMFFNGYIDDLRIYNYKRTSAQIAWDYNKGKPVAEWRFDECQGVTVHDESGNGNNGTIALGASGQTANGTCTENANTPWYNGRTGQKNASLNFDGTDDTVRSVDSPSLSITSDLTMSAWVYPVNVAGWRTIVGKQALATHASPYSNYALFRSSDTSKWAVRINAVLANFGTVNYNGWSHLVCAYTASINTVVCYINGASVAVFTNFNDTPDDSEYDLRIGSTAAGEYFSGQIDEVKIFNYALTEDQVKNLYNNSSAVYFGN